MSKIKKEEADNLKKYFLEKLDDMDKATVILEKKVEEGDNSYKNAAKFARNLCTQIKFQYDNIDFLSCAPPVSEEKIKEFQDRCTREINIARPILEKVNGWTKLLGNIAFAIVGLGFFYVLAGLINLAATGNFLFFKADVEVKLNKLQDALMDFHEVLKSGSKTDADPGEENKSENWMQREEPLFGKAREHRAGGFEKEEPAPGKEGKSEKKEEPALGEEHEHKGGGFKI